ncbi:YadA-like family protein [Haemophilus influenzae]|uniref:YadA-like family protein n=1 Tax=Haemophilus influenzae TaxID=727 RepID=UPI003DA25AB0
MSLLISTSFYPVQSFATDDTTWQLQTGKGLNAKDDAKNKNNIAIGYDSKSKGYYAVAIGYNAESNSSEGGNIAIGYGSKALNGYSSVAVGFQARAKSKDSIAVGNDAEANDGDNAVAFGQNAKVSKLPVNQTTPINGTSKQIVTDSSGNVINVITTSQDEETVINSYGATFGSQAFGYKASSHGLLANSFGAFSTTGATGATAYGAQSSALGKFSTAIGFNSKARQKDSSAFGYFAEANEKDSLALGANSTAEKEKSVALGNYSIADRANTVSVGSQKANYRRQIVNVADGTEDYDAVNVRQLNAVETKIGQVNNQFTQVDTRLNRTDLRINRVGASAAALASLKPAQLGEDDKFALSLGVGSYKNAQAVAMGAVFKPAENVLLNVAGSFSGSEKTFGAGVSWKFGNKSKPAVSTQSAVNSAEVLQLRQEMSAMQKELAELKKALRK